MPRIVVFDENATPQVALRVTGYSAAPDEYAGRTDVVLDPDLSQLLEIDPTTLAITSFLVPLRDWKHENGAIVEWTAGEKATRQAALDAAQAADEAQRLIEIRAGAATGLDDFEETPLLLRAFADIVKDELNILRAEHALPARTLAQLRSAITARVNDGTVDS